MIVEDGNRLERLVYEESESVEVAADAEAS